MRTAFPGSLFSISCWESQWWPVRGLKPGMKRDARAYLTHSKNKPFVQRYVYLKKKNDYNLQVPFSSSRSLCSGEGVTEGVGTCCFYFLLSGASGRNQLFPPPVLCIWLSWEPPNPDPLQRLIQLHGRWPGTGVLKRSLARSDNQLGWQSLCSCLFLMTNTV